MIIVNNLRLPHSGLLDMQNSPRKTPGDSQNDGERIDAAGLGYYNVAPLPYTPPGVASAPTILQANLSNQIPEGIDDLLPFTLKLHACLDDASSQGFDTIISWETDNLFKVHDVELFTKLIMPRYFKSQSRYKSFQRQLNLYEFERITSGVLKGAYRHELFRRGNRALCYKMSLRKLKGRGLRSSTPPSPTPSTPPTTPKALKSGNDKAVVAQKQAAEDAHFISQQQILQPQPTEQQESRHKEDTFEGRKFFTI
eukprot:scaffold12200_cov122-Cylindrotheca_fusiformis.AAC.2